jgi:alpha-L-fucosidase
MGSWLAHHGDAVYGSSAASWVADPEWGAITRRSDKLYLSVYDWSNSLHLKVWVDGKPVRHQGRLRGTDR